jgi:hypothetical protein
LIKISFPPEKSPYTRFPSATRTRNRFTETERRVGIDQLVIGGIVGVKEIFEVQFFTGIDRAGDFLVEHLEKVLYPEAVIDKEVFAVLLFNEKTAALEIVDDIFDDENEGLTLGAREREYARVKFIEIKTDICQQFDNVFGKKSFSLREDQVPFFVQVFPFQQGIDDDSQAMDQMIGILLVQIPLVKIHLREKVQQERI